MGQLRGHGMIHGFSRTAAFDGVHDTGDIATNEYKVTEIKDMRKSIRRRVAIAFAIVKRDPMRAVEFIADVLILIGMFTLIIIAVKTAKCVGVV